jgi:transcriptional regulator with XRE-family HTH domain
MSPVRVYLAEWRATFTPELSQSALAKAANVRRATIIELEQGKASRVSLDVVERVANALGISPAELFAKPSRTRKRGR